MFSNSDRFRVQSHVFELWEPSNSKTDGVIDIPGGDGGREGGGGRCCPHPHFRKMNGLGFPKKKKRAFGGDSSFLPGQSREGGGGPREKKKRREREGELSKTNRVPPVSVHFVSLGVCCCHFPKSKLRMDL